MEKTMEFIVTNYTMIIALICVIIYMIQKIWEFVSLPTASKKRELQKRLLEWVRASEEDLKNGTGRFKLAQVYDIFCKEYPELKKWFPLEKFEGLVDIALEEMENAFSNETTKINALKSNELN